MKFDVDMATHEQTTRLVPRKSGVKWNIDIFNYAERDFKNTTVCDPSERKCLKGN